MNAVDVLERLSALGVAVTPTPRGTLYLEPASVIPPDLVETVRQHKAEIIAHLRQEGENADSPVEQRQDYELNEVNEKTPRGPQRGRGHYRQKYPGDGPPGEDELTEIERRVEQAGYVLLWSTILKDLVAFYRDEESRKKIPRGFVPYSEEEMEELFGEGKDAPSADALRLIHEGKKYGAHIVRSVPDLESETDGEG